jgi:hypothetical protein
MALTPEQELLVEEIRRISVNTTYPQDFTLNIQTFLLELIELRQKRK